MGKNQGHPAGLYVLFFTEMWERFSYYGMRALLMLYMVNYLKWSQQEASGYYKWYTSLVYLTPILGGYLADRYLGNKWAVIIGSILMAIGQFLLTVEDKAIFLSALGFLIVGNGFFKPNMSTQVGRLYPQNDARRDGAYTIFYMGINLGAFLAPLVCGWLMENTEGEYHSGFVAAGVGMILGLCVYLFGLRWIVEIDPTKETASTATGGAASGGAISEAAAEQTPSAAPTLNRIAPKLMVGAGAILAIAAAVVGLAKFLPRMTGDPKSDFLPDFSSDTPVSLAIVSGCAFIGAWITGKVRQAVRDRVLTVYILGIFVVFFWAAFEQAGNAMNLWADKTTNRYLTEEAKPPSLYPEIRKPSQVEEKSGSVKGFWERWTTLFRLKDRSSSTQSAKETSGSAGWTKLFNPVPTTWFQSINALAIFLLAPIFAWLWTALDQRGWNPSVPTKMAFGVMLMGLAFALMIAAGVQENGASTTHLAQLPPSIKLNAAKQLCAEEDGRLYPYQAGRLFLDAEKHELHMSGVLPDIERDRIVRATAPESFKKAVDELKKKSEESGNSTNGAKVQLTEIPPGFDLRYAGFTETDVRLDADKKELTTNLKLADKDVKGILVAAGDPDFRTAMDDLFVKSAQFRVSPWWLFWFYIFSTLGELCLSPVGLSMVSKLAPAKFATMLMGLWLLTSFFGNFAAGAFGEMWGTVAPTPYFFWTFAALAAASLVLFVLVRKIVSMMHGVK